MSENSTTERRQEVRVSYPKTAYPDINIAGKVYSIAEISGHGLVFFGGGFSFYIRQSVFGFIHFADGGVVAVEGEIVRMRIDRIIVRLNRSIPDERLNIENKQA